MTLTDVSRSLPCIRCGYELNHLPEQGTCPECGLAIRESLAGTRLPLHDQDYVRCLRVGFTLMSLESVLVLLGIPFALVAVAAILDSEPVGLAVLLWALSWAAAAIPWLAGCLLCTATPAALLAFGEIADIRRRVRRWMLVKLCPLALVVLVLVLEMPTLVAASLIGPVLAAAVYCRGVVFDDLGRLAQLAAIGIGQPKPATVGAERTGEFRTVSRWMALFLLGGVTVVVALAMFDESVVVFITVMVAVAVMPLPIIWALIWASVAALFAEVGFKLRTCQGATRDAFA